MARKRFMALLLLCARRQRNRSGTAGRIRPRAFDTWAVICVGSRTTYLIRDREGHLRAKHHRIDNPDGSKHMWWEMPDGSKGLNGTPLSDLPLYGSELVEDCREDEQIVMVEGEKARDALEDAGVPALGTVTGAGGTPGPEALEVLRDRRVCLWPDNDDPGRNHMEGIAERLDGVAAEVLVYTWHEAPEKGDAADHPAILSKNPKAIDKLLTELEGAPRWKAAGAAEGEEDGRSTPTTPSTPILEDLPAAPPFPIDTLPVAGRRLVREAEAAIGCPPEMIAVPLLVTLSAGIGASRVVQLKRGWREGATLFAAVVGRPGSKKTPADKAATAPAWERQIELARKYRKARKVYEDEYGRWKKRSREASEDEESAPEPPDEPKLGRTVVGDTTTEALFEILEANPRGVLVSRDELTGWLRSMDQYKGKGSDRQVWLSMWSNIPAAIDRKGRAEPIIVPRPFVSLVGSVQPERLPELARGPDDGLWDRFLVSYPELKRTPISDAEISDEARDEVKQLYDDLAALEMPEDESGEPYPTVVPLSPDAWEVFKEVAYSLAEEADAPGFPARLEGAWSKLEAYLARLSLILALCRVAKQGGEERVEAGDVVIASGLIDYFKAHAYRVHVGLHGTASQDVLAKDLAEFLRESGGKWKDEANVLHAELTNRGSEAVPGRPDELGKMVYAISSQGTWLKAEPGWTKNEEGKSRRAIHLCFKNGVDGVVGVDQQPD
jgi:hypothetical protein